MRNKTFLILGILLVIALIALKLSDNKKQTKEEIQAAKEAISFAVEAVEVTVSIFSDSASYSGIVEVPNIVNIVSETDGRILRLNIQEGSTVQKGKVIAVLNRDTKTSYHQIHQIDYKKAKEDYQRYLELYKRNNATGMELETARHALETAEKQLNISKEELSKSTIYSPISGVITTKSVNVGDVLAPGSPVAVIVPLNEIEVRFNVPEKEIYKIQKGQPISFSVDAHPQQIFRGTVSAIIPTANQAKSFPILVKVQNNQNGITLMGGMTANIKMENTESKPMLTIPRTAVQGDFKSPYVWLVGEGKKAIRRSFNMGQEMEDQVEVLSGLKAGDIVVTKGQSNISEGIVLESVKITKGKTN